MRLPDRAFKALMRLFPSEFRGDYEREMAATFRAERQAAAGSVGIVRLWIATIADIFRTAPGEHLDILRRDIAYAGRMLARRPALTITAIVTLMLGIGANTAIFTVVDGVLFAPLPYPDADRLVLVEEHRGDRDPGPTGYLSFDALRTESASMDALAAFSSGSAIFGGDGKEAERVPAARVTWNYFATLGLSPALGRDFAREEDHPDRRRVAIISDALWRRRYGADRSIVGRTVTINLVAYTLAGVMPSGVTELVTARKFPDTEVWTVLGYNDTLTQACRTCRHIHVVGRMKRGVMPAAATADLTRVYRSLATRFPSDYDRPSAVVTTVREYFLGPAKRPLYLLWGAVGLLMLIACANIANLLLIRASEREDEIAIRRALGVSPARLVRQLITEAVVLASIGGVAGALVAWWGTRLLTAYGPREIPRLDEVSVNGRVLLYVLAVSVATGVIFGMAPARALVAARGTQGLSSRRATAGPRGWRQRAALVAVNVAVSALLLTGSGLLLRSFARLTGVDPGFTPAQLLTFQVNLAGQQFGEPARITQFYDDVSARLEALPDVRGVSAATQLPLTGSLDRSGITIEGRVLDNPAASPNADRYAVRPGYFEAMGVPLVRGRLFTAADAAGSTPVAIVGRTMAEQLWPGRDPIGQRIRIAGGEGNPMRTIVGIVGDVRHNGLHLPVTPQVYMPHAQMFYAESMLTMVVRVAAGRDPLTLAPAIRELVRSVDSLQPITRLQTFDAFVDQAVATRRFTLALLGVFAGTALVLAVVGLYGALSYAVSQRQRELGLRVALGAGRAQIRALVLRQGLTPALLGLGGGLIVSIGTGRVLESLLYGTSPTDAATFAAVAGVMGGCAMTACLLPARRAAGVDPAVTLKAD
jgi:putative ABC transport system permease protein